MERKVPPCLYTGLRREFVWGLSDSFSETVWQFQIAPC